MGLFDHFPYTNVHELNLDWVLDVVKELYNQVDALEDWKSTHEAQYLELKEFMDAINSGNFPESMITALYNWISENALDLVGSLVKMVFFGLTDDGHFVAYFPENWSDITFGTTGLDAFPAGVGYGHLTISY